MTSCRIIDNSAEVVMAILETGLTGVVVNVRRRYDDFYLDWNDYTFKSVGWTTKDSGMAEVGTTGQYEKTLNLGSVVNVHPDDIYVITVTHSTSAYSPQVGELKAGDWVDKLSCNRRIKNAVHDSDGNLVSAVLCTYKNSSDATNDVNPILTIAATGTASGGFQTDLLETEI